LRRAENWCRITRRVVIGWPIDPLFARRPLRHISNRQHFFNRLLIYSVIDAARAGFKSRAGLKPSIVATPFNTD